MTYTYDLNTNGCLILRADTQDIAFIKQRRAETHGDWRAESEVLSTLLFPNSELSYIGPEEIGVLTSAPILGLRDDLGKPIAAWGFMDYVVRSFLDDLIERGKAVFIS